MLSDRENNSERIFMQDRKYQRKRQIVEKFIRKRKTVDHYVILNEVDIDYDTLMKILSELRNEGHLK
jgi:biopolymer transport protein ExbD